MSKNFKNYFAAVKYLESIFNLPQPDYPTVKKGREIFIKRMKYFLSLLGNPQNKIKFIHVAGTSGKGSIVNMLQSVLTEAGYRVGQYTSPHPTTTIEKYKVGHQLINPDDFARLAEKIKPAVDQCYINSPYGRPSYYEMCTAIAFLYFLEQKVDCAVLEVGLGGRLDATNVIPAPLAAVINRIGLDHTDLLGKKITEIAAEKSGIIKPGSTVFVNGKNSQPVLKVFIKASQKQKADLHIVKPEKGNDYQSENRALVTAIAKHFGVSPVQIQAGLKKVKTSCRFELIQKNPRVILDGAHNETKIATVAENLKNLTYEKLYLIIALTNERNAGQIFKKIKNQADYLYITRYQSSPKKCQSPLKLAKKLQARGKTKIFLDPKMALKNSLASAKKNDLILVTGSFYLAGELRQYWRPEEKILQERKI